MGNAWRISAAAAFTIVALAVATLALAVVTAGAATGSPMLAAVNAQRVANGLPAVTWNDDWSAKCKLHNQYGVANGGWDSYAHGETEGKAGYTADGEWAGEHSVLAWGGITLKNFTTDPYGATPWEWAPIHLIQVLSPSISSMGGDTTGGYSCLTTWPGYSDPAATDTPVFYSYPGNGTTGIYARELASESPTTPEKELGLGDGYTGPNLFVYAQGFDRDTLVVSATLTGPGGALVDLAWWDAELTTLRGYSPEGSVMLIPKHELVGHTTYTVAVTLKDPRPALTQPHYDPATRKWERVVTRPAYEATASYTFTFTTRACRECRHVLDRASGLLDVKPGPPGALIVSSNGESNPVFAVSVLRRGSRVGDVCRTTVRLRRARGHAACSVWVSLGRFRLNDGLADGDTTVALASLIRRRVAGAYRVTAFVDGTPKTVPVVVR